MKVRVEVKMLAVVVVLFLASGMSDGLVIEKCELGDELNSTLPAKILDKITNLVAKIVCHAELSSHLNTSTINYVTGPNIKSFIHGGRKGRSSHSSSEESSEEDFGGPRSGFNSSMVNPVTSPKRNNSASGEGHKGRKVRSSHSSSEESSEEDFQGPRSGFNSSMVNPVTSSKSNNSASGEGHTGRKVRSVESSSEESSEEDFGGPRSGFNSSMVNPVTSPKSNNSASGEGHTGRKVRSSHSSSEESSEEHFQGPKSGFNSSMVNPVTSSKSNNSASGEGHTGRKVRSAESSSEESDETNTWTLYGLFQLPDRIACTSGLEPSLNLCSMDCDRLIDDNIQDDITCIETILDKMLSAGNSNGPNKALFLKLRAAFFQKECKKAENFEYFSSC